MESFFGIGIAELIFIAIIALIVLGPERLPGAIRTVGSVIRQVRNLSNELSSQFSEELKTLDEINPKKLLKEISDDFIGEDEEGNKNAKGAVAKTGTAATATKATTRPAATAKPRPKSSTAATTPRATASSATTTSSPSTRDALVKKVVASSKDADEKSSAANEKAPDDQASASQAESGQTQSDQTQADKGQVDQADAAETEATETRATGAESVQPAAEAQDASIGQASSDPIPAGAAQARSAAESADTNSASADAISTDGAGSDATGAQEPNAQPATQKSSDLPGMGAKKTTAGFAAGSIPRHRGIPAKSRKSAEAEPAALDTRTTTEPSSPVDDQPTESSGNPAQDMTPVGEQAADAPAAEAENSILPPHLNSSTPDTGSRAETSTPDAVNSAGGGEDAPGAESAKTGASETPMDADMDADEEEPAVEKTPASSALRVNAHRTENSQDRT